ncbi:MAG: hypothetical protein BGO95_01225 [Micrococcales bacterium 73-13]|nr:MAG: hypothetical protein BGO95_01225 [Micrococcales bacterium 73-13]
MPRALIAGAVAAALLAGCAATPDDASNPVPASQANPGLGDSDGVALGDRPGVGFPPDYDAKPAWTVFPWSMQSIFGLPDGKASSIDPEPTCFKRAKDNGLNCTTWWQVASGLEAEGLVRRWASWYQGRAPEWKFMGEETRSDGTGHMWFSLEARSTWVQFFWVERDGKGWVVFHGESTHRISAGQDVPGPEEDLAETDAALIAPDPATVLEDLLPPTDPGAQLAWDPVIPPLMRDTEHPGSCDRAADGGRRCYYVVPLSADEMASRWWLYQLQLGFNGWQKVSESPYVIDDVVKYEKWSHPNWDLTLRLFQEDDGSYLLSAFGRTSS